MALRWLLEMVPFHFFNLSAFVSAVPNPVPSVLRYNWLTVLNLSRSCESTSFSIRQLSFI